MSKNNVLYVKGKAEEDLDDDRLWDDDILTLCYDKGMALANAQVARHLAMSTNTQDKSKFENDKKAPKSSVNKKKEWRVGSMCRAIYAEDELEYEAVVVKINNKEECTVKFIGYDNTDVVPISTLKPSHGEEVRLEQVENAMKDKEDEIGTQSHTFHNTEYANNMPNVSITEPAPKKKQPAKKKKPEPQSSNFELPSIPVQMPDLSVLKNLCGADMPLAPPPPLQLARAADEDQLLSSMLLSWYMSGYQTGYYQGVRNAKKHLERDN